MQELHLSTSSTRQLLQTTQKSIEDLSEVLTRLIEEDAMVTSHLKWLKIQVQEAESKSLDLKGHIEATRLSKTTMETVAEKLRTSLSPIKSLPTETLVHIFKCAITLSRFNASTRRSTPDRTSLHFAQVCRRWRNIFALNSSLWSRLEFHANPNDGVASRDAEIHRFRRCARAGVPSRQSLIIPKFTYDRLLLLCRTLGTQPIPYKILEIDMLEDPQDKYWHIDILSAQEVIIYHKSTQPVTDYVMPLLRFARKVTIFGCLPRWAGLPWASLRTLVLNEEPPDWVYFKREDLIELLHSIPLLTRLELAFPAIEEHLKWDDSISISHPTISHIKAHLHHFVGGMGLFGVQLDLPSLHTIELLSIHCDSALPDSCAFVNHQLHPKRIILPELEIQEVTVAADLLRRTPHFEILDLSGINTDRLIQYLHSGYQHLTDFSTLPCGHRLATLHINDTDIQSDTLLQYVRTKLKYAVARAEGIHALENIEMYETPGVTPPDWWSLQALLEDGRKINSLLL